MRDDFCIFILTNGRPDNVTTYNTLIRAGYTGKLYIVIDDEDESGTEYLAIFGDKVLVFSKEEISLTFDQGDNFQDRHTIVYARNACFELAEKVGCKYFMQLDDDYSAFGYRFNDKFQYWPEPVYNLNKILEILLEYFISTPIDSLAIAQGGDFIGGSASPNAQSICSSRKAMNTFLCDTEKPFQFVGRINEDVNTYTAKQRTGLLFLTYCGLSIVQKSTQATEGGMTGIYLDAGTYVKSFYSIMYAPSCVKISDMGDTHKRIHHQVNWNAATPKILAEQHRK